MLHHWLNRLAVFGYIFSDRLIVSEIVADAISREDFRRHQAGADIAAVITQHELIKPGLPRGPILLGRDEDRLARRASWPAKNKGVDAIAFEDFDKGQLAGSFFHHDGGESAFGETNDEQNNKEKFKAHRNQVKMVNRVLGLSNRARQQFPTARI
jgi:hypothetical protein